MTFLNCLIFYLMLGFASPLYVLGQSNTVFVDDTFEDVIMGNNYAFMDMTQSMDFQEVRGQRFEPISGPLTGDVYWVKFNIVNAQSTDLPIILEFKNWKYVDMYYKCIHAGEFSHKKTGHVVPYKERDYPVANQNYIFLQLHDNDSIQAFVRLEKGSDYFRFPTNLDFRASTQVNVMTREAWLRSIIYLFLGIYFVMFMYNFFIYVSIKDKSYLYYLIILVIMAFIGIHNFGYTISLFKGLPKYPIWHVNVEMIISALLGIMIFRFASSFLELKTRLPGWQKVLNVLTVLVFLMPIPSFFGLALVNQDISSILGVLSLIIVFTIGIRSYQKGTPSAGYFVLAYGTFIIGLVVFLSGDLTGFWKDDSAAFIVQLGSTSEVILFSFALGNRINILRDENEKKQKQIIVHLEENQQLQTKVNRELEQKVKERTVEVEKQKEELQVEKEKSESLLLNILPEATAEELKKKGYASTRYYENVSVLFTDFKDFTNIAEKMSADDLVSRLDHFFKGFDEIIEKYHLEKIKTIGDAYMCAGGIPKPNNTNAMDTIRAGLEMQQFVNEWNENNGSKDEKWLLRLGIHTGEAITGVVGKKKFAYDIWGDTVNIASRLETGGEPGKVNISESTFELVKSKCECKHRGKIIAKNKGEIDMYFVTGLKQAV